MAQDQGDQIRRNRSSSVQPLASHQEARPQFLTLTILYGGGITLGIAIFIVSFVSRFLSSIDIFFYRGLVVIALASVFHAALLTFGVPWIRRSGLSRANLVSIVAVSAMLNLTFFTLVPVNLDRSISVFLLAWMGNDEDKPMTRADLQDVFNKVYVGRYQAIDRRIEEQIVSGNIKKTSAGFVLTERGRVFNRFAKTVGAIFSVDPRFLNPHCETSEVVSGLAGCAAKGAVEKP